MVPFSPQGPQGIGLPTLLVFEGAVVSSERFSQSLPPRNVAELGGSPPLRGTLEQLDWPSPAGPLLQGTKLATLSTPEASLEQLVPLVGHLVVWEPLPSMSHWVMPEQTLILLVFLGDDAGLRTVVSNRRPMSCLLFGRCFCVFLCRGKSDWFLQSNWCHTLPGQLTPDCL